MRKKILIVIAVIIVLLGLGYINLAIYPFRTNHPNFSDVERVFNKMQFPADWQQISESENRGIAGRACPIEPDSACYHKSKTFSVNQETGIEKIKTILLQAGCPTVSIKENSPVGGSPYTTLNCSTDGLSLAGQLDVKNNSYEVYITVRT